MLNQHDPILQSKDSEISINTELTPKKTYLTTMKLNWRRHQFVAKKEAKSYLNSVSKCYHALKKQWDKIHRRKIVARKKIKSKWENAPIHS